METQKKRTDYSEGYERGYSKGYDSGYGLGFDRGFEEGYEWAKREMRSRPFREKEWWEYPPTVITCGILD